MVKNSDYFTKTRPLLQMRGCGMNHCKLKSLYCCSAPVWEVNKTF